MSSKTYDNLYLETLQKLFTRTKERSYNLLSPQTMETIVDIGCGVGQDVINLAKSGANIIGIDNDKNFIEIAKKQQHNDLQFQFIYCQADNIPIPSSTIDKVRFDRVLQHISEHEKVLNEVTRILKPNGVLQIIDTDYLSCSLFLEDEILERKIIETVAYKKIPNGHKIRKLPSTLKRIGFTLTTTEIHNYIVNDFEFANYIIRFDNLIKEEFNNGNITDNQLDLWQQGKSNFHFSLNLIIYQATKN